MITRNKKFTLITLLIILLTVGTSAYANDTIASLFSDINSENNSQIQEVEKRLNQSWDKGRKLILQNRGNADLSINKKLENEEYLSNWEFMNIDTLNNELASFSIQERSSFLEALYSKERTENLHIGDYMPALLMNSAKSHAIVYWEKANGSYVFMELKTEKEDSNSWYVDNIRFN